MASERNLPSLAGGHNVIFLYVRLIFQPPHAPPPPPPHPDNYCTVPKDKHIGMKDRLWTRTVDYGPEKLSAH